MKRGVNEMPALSRLIHVQKLLFSLASMITHECLTSGYISLFAEKDEIR